MSTSAAGMRNRKNTSARTKSEQTGQAVTAKATPIYAKLGYKRAQDLVLHLPHRYEDETTVLPIAQALHPSVQQQAAQFEGVVVDSQVTFGGRRQWVLTIADDTGQMNCRFLHWYSSQQKAYAVGRKVRVRGEVRGGFFGVEMVHPAVRVVLDDEPLPTTLTPVYPSVARLAQSAIRKSVLSALGYSDLSDTLPAQVLQRMQLWSFADAITTLHNPPAEADSKALSRGSHPAWQRIKFDELLAQQLSLKQAREARAQRSAPAIRQAGGLTQELLAKLPFALTGAQQRAWQVIAQDIAKPHPMQRLLQGDVGSGKTVVAALACARAIENGYQAALMAPTEILAEQHFNKLCDWLLPLGVQVAWLSGSQKAAQRRQMLEQIASAQAGLVVGTHALIQDTVQFAKLGLAIIDEQHRFGVTQRLQLREKAVEGEPHQLMMSATPIPRTLSMTYMADLDVAVIDELPPGRTPVVTRAISQDRRSEVIERIHAAAQEGRQIYWVCPLIEESETLQLQTAQETFEALQAQLSGLRIGLVHGKLKAAEKAAVMQQFKDNQLHVLVATTVIEVGVDVPNASLMVIEHAERFGLAQLHQLRGRVGRGAAQSACILLYAGPLGALAQQRINTMRATQDGFEIARKDLELRGPGQLLGAQQSGAPMLRFANLEEDLHLIEYARNLADDLLARAPEIVQTHLARWLPQGHSLLGV